MLSSTSDPTDDLNLIEVDPNWGLVRLVKKKTTFGLGLRYGSFRIHKLQKNSLTFEKLDEME